MSNKVSDEICLENYLKLRELFDSVIEDYNRFEMVYACGVDAQLSDTVVVKANTYDYSGYAVGFDTVASEIVILPVAQNLSEYGEAVYLKYSDIIWAKQSFISKEITIKDNRLPQNCIQLKVLAQLNKDHGEGFFLVKQDESYRKFMTFFKNQFKK